MILQELGCQDRDHAVNLIRDRLRFVAQFFTAQGIARSIVAKTRAGFVPIAQGLAQRKMQMQSVRMVRLAFQRRFHRGNIGVGKFNRLEVGQAPPNLAQTRFAGQGTSIGGDAFFLPPHGLEHMPVAHP